MTVTCLFIYTSYINIYQLFCDRGSLEGGQGCQSGCKSGGHTIAPTEGGDSR
jgi:hypothetical protein